MISSCIFSVHADVNLHADIIYILRFIRCLVYYQHICFVTFFMLRFRGRKSDGVGLCLHVLTLLVFRDVGVLLL